MRRGSVKALWLASSGWVLLGAGCSSGQPTPTIHAQQTAEDAGRMSAHLCAADAACPAAPDAATSAGTGGAAGATVPGCVPAPELCDGQDNDCDGVADNGFSYQGTPVGGPCYSSGYGACIATGRVVCASPTAAGCSGMATAPDESFHTTAAPNGSWDWNCNNNVDRKYPLASCASFSASACPAQGWEPATGQSGDCGEPLVQQACTVTATGCTATGAPAMVIEGCK